MGLVYTFRGSVDYDGGKHGSMYTDMVPEEPKVLHLDPSQEETVSAMGEA